MLTDKDLLVEAYQRGHAWNPDYPSLANLDLGRVQMMTGTERDAKDLIASRQASDAVMDRLVAAYHAGRKPQFDGSIGPATRELATIPRCAMPDHPPPPHASFHYDDPELQAAVESYQAFAEYVGGSGSWPKGCDPDYPNVHSVVTFFDDRNASTSQKNVLTEALKFTEACEAEIGQHLRHVRPPETYSKPHHHVTFGPIAGSVIGFNYFPTPNTCNQTVNGKIDSTFNASAITLANLLTHEYKGHGDGLQHTRGGIMNPSIITINPLSWLRDPSESIKRRYFGGVPIPSTPGPGPTPGPQPGPDQVVWEGALAAGTYQLVRKGGTLPPIQV
jgi:hypothetical protein